MIRDIRAYPIVGKEEWCIQAEINPGWAYHAYILIHILGYKLRASITNDVGAITKIQVILPLITLEDPSRI